MIEPDDAKIIEKEPRSDGSKDVPSPEEQMERFEEDLKENDWGHQPC
jgi:hypothetical protein